MCGGTHTEGEHGGGDGNEGSGIAMIEYIENDKPYGNVKESEAYHYKSHHRSRAERNLQAGIQTLTGSIGCTSRSIGCGLHAEESGKTGEKSTGEEGERHPWVLHLQHICHKGEYDGEDDEDNEHHLILLLEIGHRTASDIFCNFPHSRGSFVRFHHGLEEIPCHRQGYQRCNRNKPKYFWNVFHRVNNGIIELFKVFREQVETSALLFSKCKEMKK